MERREGEKREKEGERLDDGTVKREMGRTGDAGKGERGGGDDERRD